MGKSVLAELPSIRVFVLARILLHVLLTRSRPISLTSLLHVCSIAQIRKYH
jgi:hypothetical protein